MKKLIIAGVTTAMLLAAGTASFAANETNTAAQDQAGTTTTPSYHQYIDKNNDGVCDNWETHQKYGNGYCRNYDGHRQHNGNGHCRNYDSNNSNAATQSNHNMTGYGHHGNGYNSRGLNV